MDLADTIDDWCEKTYGHINWGWLSVYPVAELSSGSLGEYIIEGDVVIFKEGENNG